MPRLNGKSAGSGLIEKMSGEASWLLSHAQALADYNRKDEADAELARAARCEEALACLLEADGQLEEAAIHRVSAATCFEKLGRYARSVTLLHAALSAPLRDVFRGRIEAQLKHALIQSGEEASSLFTKKGKRLPVGT